MLSSSSVRLVGRQWKLKTRTGKQFHFPTVFKFFLILILSKSRPRLTNSNRGGFPWTWQEKGKKGGVGFILPRKIIRVLVKSPFQVIYNSKARPWNVLLLAQAKPCKVYI